MMQRVPFFTPVFPAARFSPRLFCRGCSRGSRLLRRLCRRRGTVLRRADGTLYRFPCAFRSQKSEPRQRSRAPLTRQRSSARHVFQTCARARQSGANPPLAAGFETRSTARKATFPEAGRRCHRRKSPRLYGATIRASLTKAALPRGGLACVRSSKTASIFLRSFWTPLMFSSARRKTKKSSGTSSISPPNARFGSFAIHAEDFASVIIFRLIRQTRANGRIACLRVYCTIPRRVCQRVFARADT